VGFILVLMVGIWLSVFLTAQFDEPIKGWPKAKDACELELTREQKCVMKWEVE